MAKVRITQDDVQAVMQERGCDEMDARALLFADAILTNCVKDRDWEAADDAARVVVRVKDALWRNRIGVGNWKGYNTEVSR